MTAVRVMVFGKLHRAEDRDAFEAMIPTISSKVKDATGYLRDELLRDASEPGSYIMMSEWASKEDFLAWVQSSVHPQNTSPLRAYWQADKVFKIYEIVTV